MKTAISFAVAALLLSACSTPPPVTGEFATKAGQIKIYPDGRFEIIVNPKPAK